MFLLFGTHVVSQRNKQRKRHDISSLTDAKQEPRSDRWHRQRKKAVKDIKTFGRHIKDALKEELTLIVAKIVIVL